MQFLRENGVPFQEKDVAADPRNVEELLKWTDGVRVTPVIVIGNQVVLGFDRRRMTQALGLA